MFKKLSKNLHQKRLIVKNIKLISKVNIKVLIVSALFFSMPAQALIVLQQASAPLNIDYDSNLNLSQQKMGVWRYSTIPKYSLAVLNEKNRWFTDLALTLQRSSNKNISADREDPAVGIGWQRELEKGSFSLNARYDKRSSRFTQFNTNAITDVDGTSVNRSLAASYSHAISERLNFTLGADYSKIAYTDSSFVDSTSKSINGSISYELNEKFTPFIRLSYTDFQPDSSPSQSNTNNQLNPFNNQFNVSNQASKSKNFSVGSTILIAPNWTFVPSVGVNSISSSGGGASTSGNNASASGSGWIADTSLSYIGEKNTFQATLARSVAPGGLGNFQKTDTFALAYTYDLSEKSQLGTDFNVSKSQSQFDSETMQINGFYSRELSYNWQMRLIAGHRSTKQSSFSASNNNLGVSLIYNIPQF